MSDSGYDSVPESSSDEEDAGLADAMDAALQAISQYVHANKLTIQQLFTTFDEDHSGDWNHAEFEAAMRRVGFEFESAHDSRSVFAELCGRNGRLGPKEFAQHVKAVRRADSEAARRPLHMPAVGHRQAEDMFQRVDINRTGRLSLREVTKAVRELFPDFDHALVAEMAFKAAAVSDSNRVQFPEFQHMLGYLRFLNKHWGQLEHLRGGKVDLARFKDVCGLISRQITERTAEAEFKHLSGGRSRVTFEELCIWTARYFGGGSASLSSPRKATMGDNAGPILQETLQMKNRFNLWETRLLVIDGAFEDGRDLLTVAIYGSAREYQDAPGRPRHRFPVSQCVVEGVADNRFKLRMPQEMSFQASSDTVPVALRACLFAELVCGGPQMTGWSSEELAAWLEYSNDRGVLDDALAKLRVPSLGLPGMHFAKLTQPDMREKLVQDMIEMVHITSQQAQDIIAPLLELQDDKVEDWLQAKDQELQGRDPLIRKAVRTWELHRAEQERFAVGDTPRGRSRRDDNANAASAADFSDDDDLEDEDYGTLIVTVAEAENIPKLDQLGFDRFGPPSLYVKMTLEDQEQQTSEAHDTYTPKWSEKFRLHATDPESVLCIDVYNANILSKHLHFAALKVPLLRLDEGTTVGWYRLPEFEGDQVELVPLSADERTAEYCPKGAIQLKFQYAPPQLAVDLSRPTGRRITMRRGAIYKIDRFIGAYAADELDVEARISQGLLWSNRYVVVSSVWKGEPERERFLLVTYKDKEAWDNGAEPLSKLRLGESYVGVDPRPESRGAGFFVKNRKGEAHFRAGSQSAAADWMTALRALQFSEMIMWSGSHMCRWLEAQGTADRILHSLHDSTMNGEFFARTAAAGTYPASAKELQKKAGMPERAAQDVIAKLQGAELATAAIKEWLSEVDSDLHGKSEAVKLAAALLQRPGQPLQIKREPEVRAVASYGNAPARRTRSPRKSSAEVEERTQSVTRRLEAIRQELHGKGRQRTPSAKNEPQFDPQRWKEEQDRKLLILEQTKLRKELTELENRQQQTSAAKLQERYPRGEAVYRRAGGNNPRLDNVKSKYRKEARRFADREDMLDPRNAPMSPRRDAIPADTRDPKIVGQNEPGENLALKLESLVAVHRNLSEHAPLVTAIVDRLRQAKGDVKAMGAVKRELKDKKEQFLLAQKHEADLQKDVMTFEKAMRAMQAGNELALEKEKRARESFKFANAEMKVAREKQQHAEESLKAEVQENKVLRQKIESMKTTLRNQQMDSQSSSRPAPNSEEVKKLKEEVAKWKDECKREKRKAVVAKHEATERGKLLVGAASKLEAEQERYDVKLKKLQKKCLSEKSQGFREGQQESGRENQDLTRQLQKATELVFEIGKVVSFEGHHRFKDADVTNPADLVDAVKATVERWEKQRNKLSEKDRKIRKLEDEVKELRRHLEREQAESFKMLEELHEAKTVANANFQHDNLKQVLDVAAKQQHKEDESRREVENLQNKVTTHSVQLEAEQQRTAREKEKNFRLQHELRRMKVERESASIAERENRSEIVRSERDSRAMAKNSNSKLREQQQQIRLHAMQTGTDVSKHHVRTLKTDTRYLFLSEDGKMLVYAKDRKNMLKGKKIPISDIRAVHVGFASENLGTKYSHRTTTPEWHCFSIVLRTRTVDFSTSTEEDAALWVIGLRTLLEWNRGDTRSREVGRFFWQRAAMRTRHNAKATDQTQMQYLASAVQAAAQSWDRRGNMYNARGMNPYGGAGVSGSRFDRMTAITLSPGFSPRALSPKSTQSPMERLRQAGAGARPSSPGQSPNYRGGSPRRSVGSPLRTSMERSFGSNRSSSGY